MPPLGMHMTIARELAGRVGHAALASEQGAYYLGATAPDIRVITRWERSKTHFFDLDDFEHQRGVDRIFAEHPQLANASCLNEGTVAFLCGYITHLEMDEAWICDVYRPCFGERSPLKGGPLANVLDRILQFELDRRERDDPDVVNEIRDHLLASTIEIVTPFLERETLLQWRDISAEAVVREPDLRRLASRHLRAYGVESDADMEQFVKSVPDLLEQAVREVTPDRIDAFQQRSRERAVESIREYLS